MAFVVDEKHVKIHGCFVVWDGITRPDAGPDGAPKYSLKVVVPPSCPDMPDMQQLAQTSLAESKWRGVLPPGGRMPIGTAGAHEFNGLYTGWHVLNCNSKRVPDMYDENGALMEPMQYGPLLYGGQQVDVMVHCYEYDKAGNRGIATGLDAVGIIVSANAQRHEFGSSVNTAAAFAGGSGAPAPTPTAPGAPPAPGAAQTAPQPAHNLLPGAQGAPGAAPPPPAGAAAPPPPAPAQRLYMGTAYTEEQLAASGHSLEQIASYPPA